MERRHSPLIDSPPLWKRSCFPLPWKCPCSRLCLVVTFLSESHSHSYTSSPAPSPAADECSPALHWQHPYCCHQPQSRRPLTTRLWVKPRALLLLQLSSWKLCVLKLRDKTMFVYFKRKQQAANWASWEATMGKNSLLIYQSQNNYKANASAARHAERSSY